MNDDDVDVYTREPRHGSAVEPPGLCFDCLAIISTISSLSILCFIFSIRTNCHKLISKRARRGQSGFSE